MEMECWQVEIGEYLEGSNGVSKIVLIDTATDPDCSWGDDIFVFQLENGDVVRCGECDRVTVHYPEATQ